MEPVFKLGQIVKMNGGQVTGTVVSVLTSVGDVPQYSVVWWDDNNYRHQEWVKEHEIIAREA